MTLQRDIDEQSKPALDLLRLAPATMAVRAAIDDRVRREASATLMGPDIALVTETGLDPASVRRIIGELLDEYAESKQWDRLNALARLHGRQFGGLDLPAPDAGRRGIDLTPRSAALLTGEFRARRILVHGGNGDEWTLARTLLAAGAEQIDLCFDNLRTDNIPVSQVLAAQRRDPVADQAIRIIITPYLEFWAADRLGRYDAFTAGARAAVFP